MKVEIKTNEQGYCEYFKINGKKFGTNIYAVDIHITGDSKPQVIIYARCDEFILDSGNTKLYLEKYQRNMGDNNVNS